MKYDVHIYAVVRVKYPDIEADSQKQAIDKTIRDNDLHSRFKRADAEFAEEISGYLVDEQGDEDYDNSKYYIDYCHHAGDELLIRQGTEVI